jgi:lincosamide nucleotidyltransferase A/C/D/E
MRPLSLAAEAYRTLARSRLRGIAEAGPVQRLRARLKAVGPAEVHELLDALTAAGVAPHVSGGWGVDALLGRQTRAHGDLDIVVRADEDGVHAVLHRLGYRPAPEFDPRRELEHPLMGRRTLLRDARGHEVDVHEVDAADWQQLEARGAFVRGEIGGRAVACISAEMQEETHRGYPATAKDHGDMERLRRRFGAE